MKMTWKRMVCFWTAAVVMVLLPQLSQAHVTLQTSQPLRLKANATVTLNVPNERHVDNTKVTLEVPEAFLKAGGRLSRLIYPAGWTVTLEKQDKPSDVLNQEKESRSKREADRQVSADHGPSADKTDDDKQEQAAMDELRKKWITKVTFEGGAIPPDGFQQFQISFQLPEEAGKYRFAAVQTYADGKDVSWSELVEGAEHPAPTLNVEKPPLINYSGLPLPLSAAALLIACAAFLTRSRASKKENPGSAGLMRGQLASTGGRDAR